MKLARHTLLSLAVIASTLVLAAPALAAQSSSGLGYDSRATSTQAEVGNSLPFTGLDLGLVLAAGVALLLVGLVLRRLGQRPLADS